MISYKRARRIDSFFYSLYWIGSMVDTNKFPILSGELLRDIQVVKTVEKYMARFPPLR